MLGILASPRPAVSRSGGFQTPACRFKQMRPVWMAGARLAAAAAALIHQDSKMWAEFN